MRYHIEENQKIKWLTPLAVAVVVVAVVVLTLTRINISVVTAQAPVTLEWRNTPGKIHKAKSSARLYNS